MNVTLNFFFLLTLQIETKLFLHTSQVNKDQFLEAHLVLDARLQDHGTYDWHSKPSSQRGVGGPSTS